MKKYSIIYADPPWAYKDKMSGHSFSLENEYKTQSKDWIAKLSVGSISATDSILFLWAVSPQLTAFSFCGQYLRNFPRPSKL